MILITRFEVIKLNDYSFGPAMKDYPEIHQTLWLTGLFLKCPFSFGVCMELGILEQMDENTVL